MKSFSQLGLSNEIISALNECGYTTPTDIQQEAIPATLSGQDVLAAAQTGTGKTAAFMLPSIERLKGYGNSGTSPAMHPVRMLVLTPTRELSVQIDANIKSYIKNTLLRHAVIYGGVSMDTQKEILHKGCEIVVATVGRLLDHIEQKNIQLNRVEILVLDEADRMLDMGFIDDVRKIISLLPSTRQILLFSATFAPEIRKLATDFMNNPVSIETAPKNSTANNVEQHIIAIDNWRKKELLPQLIEFLNIKQAIVFCNKKITVNQVTRDLLRRKFSVDSLHGNKSQSERLATLNAFKNGDTQILVATDVAARGLDINDMPFVINYEIPLQAEDYVHRIGRTGRAGAAGVAISLLDEYEEKLFDAIVKLTRQDLKIEQLEGFIPSWYQVATTSKTLMPDNNKNKKTSNSCKPTHTRPLRKRKVETCALLLPNFGIK
ncbi:MAG: DEAD/DEAH box helicase [Neisseriaceae bacterium]|nr:DEAD/DEAH box helicase [Neisseriaceae bacterium]